MKRFLHILNRYFSGIFKSQIAKERFFLVLLITILVFIWFRKGLIIGSGESGLPFYNSTKLLQLTMYSWTDAPLGTSGAIGSASYPFFVTITFLQNLGIPSFMIQAALYWILFVIGVLSIHKIASLISDNSALTRLSTALFYIFNPIVHISVLHRVQYPLLFFYSFIPFAFYIYLVGLTSRKLINLLWLGLATVIFSFAFIGIESIELLFGVFFSLSLGYFLFSKQKRDLFPFFYFFGFIFIFTLMNMWWLTPLFSSLIDLGKSGSVKEFSSSDNITTFKGISDQIGSVLSVFKLFKPNDYPKDESPWAWIYGTTPYLIISFFPIIAFIISLFKKNKEFLYKFLILIAFIAMFWIKGSLPPFGSFTLYLFQSFTILQVFRNPLEKIGIILPFLIAIPIGFGTSWIILFLAKKTRLPKKIIAFVVLTLVFPVYMFPILTGLAFTGGPPPSNNINIGQYVKVPTYYKDAREWLDKQPGLFRVLVLPIDGEGMTYKWDYGFAGVELSNTLFNQSMVSFNTSQAFLPEMISSINYTLANDLENFKYLMQVLNVKYVMIRDDIDYLSREIKAPETELKLIKDNLSTDFKPVADFGKLKFFELKPEIFNTRVYAAVAPTYLLDPLDKTLNLIHFSNPWATDMFITTSQLSQDYPYLKTAKKIVIDGTKIENIDNDTKDLIENLPYVSIYRDTPFYALVRFKEELLSQIQGDDTPGYQVNILGKRLVEINHSPEDAQAIDEYSKMVESLGKDLIKAKSVDKAIIESLLNQKKLLKQIRENTSHKDKIDKINSYIDNLFIKIGVKSIYPTKNNIIYRFYVPRDSKYDILVPRQDWNDYYQDKGINEFDLDGKTTQVDQLHQFNDKSVFYLGTYPMSLGVHEVSLAAPKTINLITEQLPEELILSSKDKKPVTKTVQIADLNPEYGYSLSFEYLEEKGNIPVVVLHSDVDFVDSAGQKVPRFGIALARDNYDFGWKKYTATFTPFPTSSKYYISIKIIPFGDCKAVVKRPYRRYCEDNSFNQRFLQDSTTKIRNLKVEKVINNPVILREEEIPSATQSAIPQISFEKVSPARYKVRITDVKNPFFLILSTAFDPRWVAYFVSSKPKSIVESLSDSIKGDPLPSDSHLVVNGYANAWHIDKTGSFDMYLEYSPERVFIIGRKFSFVLLIISILLALVYLIRRFVLFNKGD